MVFLLLAALLSGCVGIPTDPILRTGPGANFNPEEVKNYRDTQDRVLAQLYLSAGLEKEHNTGKAKEPTGTIDWSKVINAGIDYADQRCEAYMHALFRLNRDKSTAVSQVGLLGGATAGIQAATSALAKEVAITAVLFGLASSTIENYSSNLLYELEPSSVRSLVKGLQAAYKSNLPTTYDTKPAAIAVIRGYAVLCVPANIEAEVNLAVKKSQPDAKKGDGATGQPPAVSHNLPVATISEIGDAQRINRAVASLIKDKTKLAEINRILKEIDGRHKDIPDFQTAADAIENAFREMTPADTSKWLKSLGIR